MKKIIVAALVLLGGLASLHAQSMEVYINGIKVKNGDTVELVSPAPVGEMIKAFTVIKNVSEQDLTFTASRSATLPSDVEMGWCLFGECLIVNNMTASMPKAPGEYWGGNTDDIYLITKGYTGDAIYIDYTISSVELPKESISFKVHWTLGPVVENAFKMTFDGKEVKDGKSYKFEAETIKTGVIEADITFENPGEKTIKVNGFKNSFIPEGTSDRWCVLGGCWLTPDYTASQDIAPGEIVDEGQTLDFEPKGYVGSDAYVYYTFFVDGDPYNRVSFVVNWVTTTDVSNEGKLPTLKTSAYPNPANDNVSISWEQTDKNTKLNIRSVSGQLVKTLNTSGLTQTNLNVRDWTPGMYFYSIEANGTRLGGGKIIVK